MEIGEKYINKLGLILEVVDFCNNGNVKVKESSPKSKKTKTAYYPKSYFSTSKNCMDWQFGLLQS